MSGLLRWPLCAGGGACAASDLQKLHLLVSLSEGAGAGEATRALALSAGGIGTATAM